MGSPAAGNSFVSPTCLKEHRIVEQFSRLHRVVRRHKLLWLLATAMPDSRNLLYLLHFPFFLLIQSSPQFTVTLHTSQEGTVTLRWIHASHLRNLTRYWNNNAGHAMPHILNYWYNNLQNDSVYPRTTCSLSLFILYLIYQSSSRKHHVVFTPLNLQK